MFLIFDTIYFSQSFFLTNVLYVPNFSLNLISVVKLCYTLPCLVSFTNSQRLVQDPQSLKTIGSAKLIEGLYHLVLPDKIRNVSAAPCNYDVIIPENALWH